MKDKTGSIPSADRESVGGVRGTLTDADGLPMTGVLIALFEKRLRSEENLGQISTIADGQYSITYLRRAAMNLVVRATDETGKTITESDTVFSAPADVEINLTVRADGIIQGTSTFIQIDKALGEYLGGLSLGDLKENNHIHELQFLADATSLPFNHIAYRFIANILSAKRGIKEATFFGIFQQNIPHSLSAALTSLPDAGIDEAFTDQVLSGVLAHSRNILDQALTSAVRANVIPSSYAAAQESELTLLDALRAKAAGEAPYRQSNASLIDLLAAGGVSGPVKTAFVQTYADQNGHVESTWTKLHARTDLASQDLNTLELTLSASEALGGSLPLIKDTLSRISQKTLAGVQNLAMLDESDWIARITAVDPEAASIPPARPEEPTAQRIERFARALSESFTAKYPTTSFAGKLSKAQNSSFAKTRDEITRFLTANPSFTFKQTNIDHFVSTNKAVLSASALADLKTAQRLSRLAPDFAAVEALRNAGHNSAFSIYAQGRAPFIAQMTTPLGSEAAAKLTYARAQMTHATALTAYGRYNLALNGVSVAALAPAAPDPTLLTNLPDLQALFGSLDSFECEDCQSILSPAAYLVDLLQYLGQFVAGFPITGASNTAPITITTASPQSLQTGTQVSIAGVLGNTSANGGPFTITVTSATSFTLNGSTGNGNWSGGGYVFLQGLQNARDALLSRRPDIRFTALSCNNTNVTLPYIDLVNEILESAIAPPLTALAVIDTTGTSDERRALPQNLSQAAYAQTKQAVFPLNLPFDLAFAQTTAYVNALGTTRAALLTLFYGIKPSALGPSDAIAGALLGINPEIQTVINGTDTNTAWGRWGLAQNPPAVIDPKTRTPYSPVPTDWVAALNKVPVLLSRAGLTIEELYQLLEVVWVTQSNVSLQVGTTAAGGVQVISADTDLMAFTGLTSDVLDRANRFLRLWTASGLEMWELDWAIGGLGSGSLSGLFLFYLTGAMALQNRLKIPFQEVLGFWAPLETRDVTSHIGDEDVVIPSTYSEVFRNPTVLLTASNVFTPLSTSTIAAASSGPSITTTLPHGYQTAMQVKIAGTLAGTAVTGTFAITVTSPVSFTLNDFTGTGAWGAGGSVSGILSGNPIFATPVPPATSAPPTAEQNAISAALGLSAADISAILTFSGASSTLSTATLGQLLNYQRLASALSLDISSLILLIEITAGKPFGYETSDTLEFLRRFDVLQSTGLAAADLNYLLRNQAPGQSSLAPAAAQLSAILQTMRDAIAKLPGATVLSITGVSNASPIVITTAAPNTLQSGNQVGISGVQGNTEANGTFTITVVSPTSFSLNGSTGSGNWTSGGTVGFLSSLADPSAIQNIFINALATAFGATANVVTPVVLKTGILPLAPAVIDLLIAQGGGADPAQFPSLINAFTVVAKAVALFNALKPTEAEFAFAVQNVGSFNWLDPSLSSAPPATGSYLPFESLLGAIKLNRRHPATAPGLFDVFNQWLSPGGLPGDLTTAILELAPAFNATVTDTQAIASQFGATAPNLTLPGQTDSLADIAMLTNIANALDMAARYRISAGTLIQLGSIPATASTASAAVAALQAQYPKSSWLSAIQPVEDALRKARRDALVSYMLGPGPATAVPQLLSTDDIYDYYLIDPEMSPCAQTTRLLQPSLAIQQFVQQCFLNLNFVGISIDITNSAWTEWSWRQQYRLWQANREVFLYPENYVLPETRTDSSPFFSDLENDIRQGGYDAAAAETALESYLRKLATVANLQIVASCTEAKPDGSSVLHVFARAPGATPVWYYRSRTGTAIAAGSWTAWQQLDLDIDSQHVMPLIWDQRLCLIWAVFKQVAQAPADQTVPNSGGGGTQPVPKKFWAIQLTMSEFSAGQWQTPTTFSSKIFSETQDSPLDYTFLAFTPGAGQLTIQVFRSGYYLASVTSSTPDAPLYISEQQATLTAIGNQIDAIQEPSYGMILGNLFDLGSFTPRPLTWPNCTLSGQDQAYGVNNATGAPTGTVGSVTIYQSLGGGGIVIIGGNPPPPPVTVELLAKIVDPRIVKTTRTGVDFVDPFFVADSLRTYLVQQQYVTDPTGGTNYIFQSCYHPYARTFLRQLEISGVSGLMSRNLQLNPQTARGWTPVFDFNALYSPTAAVAKPYPGAGGSDTGETNLDFAVGSAGPYSLYNWELFYHIPMFMASILMQNQQYQDTLNWLEYIFNPTDTSGGPAPQRFWQMAPFNAGQANWAQEDIQVLLTTGINDPGTTAALNAWIKNPFDPHAVASLRISAYAKATVMKFLDNLIAWGDSYYSQYTAETVGQAEQLYVLADLILGPRPQSLRIPTSYFSSTTTSTYASLENINAFSNVLVSIENLTVAPEPTQSVVEGTGAISTLPVVMSSPSVPLFCIPPNNQLLAYWDTVFQRLQNIRSCRNIQGVLQPLPLYAPPINPLFAAAAAGSSSAVSASFSPIYRFSTYLQKALELANDVRSYGSLILSVLEKQDAEALSLLRANQELNIQTRMLDVKSMQVTEAQDQISALQSQKQVVQTRHDYYASRPFMNDWETSALSSQQEAVVKNNHAVDKDKASAPWHQVPSISVGIAGWGGTPNVGSSWGGENRAGFEAAWAGINRGIGEVLNQRAGLMATQGTYQRRQDDWTFQTNSATDELTQIGNQIDAAKDRLNIANQELAIQQSQVANAQAVATFLTNKYTNVQLYNWMTGQVSTVYAQAYQLAFSLALQAQNAYQYELGVRDTFLQSGYWDGQHKGLMAGESLLLDLRRMEAQYLAANSRELELTKHISLLLTFPAALVMLRETGMCQIALDEAIFENDHPGQYFRRLRLVALTFPCVRGPYTGVNATLTLTGALVRTTPPNSTYAPQSATAAPNDPSIVTSPTAAAKQIIATSHGQNDSGLFDANPHEDRWLPFEGQGAISTWNLTLDPRDNNFDFTTITDVILHVRYTARDGGDANAVRTAIKSQIETSRSILVSVRNTFGNAYYTFFNPPVATAASQTLTLPMANTMFPYSNLGSGIKIAGIDFYVVLSVSAAGNGINATFDVETATTPAGLTLAPSTITAADGSAIAALTGSFAPSAALAAPQSFDLTVPSTAVPVGLAAAQNGTTRIDPNKVQDILLVVNYSIT